MAIYRNVQMSFWTDPDIADDYTPKDKLFYLYMLTNPHTNLCGCYEVSIRQMAYEVGYTTKEIEELIDRAQNIHHSIAYSNDTRELLIIRWSKYNWTASDKFRALVLKEIQKIKSADFRQYLVDVYNGKDTVYEIFDTVSKNLDTVSEKTDTLSENSDTVSKKTDTVSDKEGYPIQHDYTVTDTDTDTVYINNIVNYLNTKCGTKYKASSDSTKKHIRARLAEGYTEDDFRTVIDKKYDEWHGTEQEKYLRPETLFGSKFEGYLNQKINSPPKKNKFDNFEQRKYDFNDLERQLLKGG